MNYVARETKHVSPGTATLAKSLEKRNRRGSPSKSFSVFRFLRMTLLKRQRAYLYREDGRKNFLVDISNGVLKRAMRL